MKGEEKLDLYTVRKELNMGIPLANIKLRVTDYARVSTDHLEQKKSLQNQVEHFEQYIKDNPNWTYITGYVDDGITGTSDIKRDNFMQMIEDARNGKFDLIITKEISRFSRNTLDSIKYTRELLSYGVAVLFVNDNINTIMPDSELRLTIMASMAQDEIRRLSERVKFGMNRAIERGEVLGNNLLYGYKKDKDTGVLNIVLDEAKVVRKIYELYAVSELSLSKIAKMLNSSGLRTYQGNKWCVSTISRMIENPKYKGYYCGKKSEIIDYMTKKVKHFEKNDWITYENKEKIIPIVDEILWERANKRLQSRKKNISNVMNNSLYKNRYLYSSKLYCLEHSTVFHRRHFRKKTNDISWVCSNYLKKGKINCDSVILRESELNSIFYDLIDKLGINLNDVLKVLMHNYSQLEMDNGTQEKISIREKEIKEVNDKKDKLLELSLNNSLSNIEFVNRNEYYNERLKIINKELNDLLEEKKRLEKVTSNDLRLKKLESIIKLRITNKSILDRVIYMLLDHIMVSKINDSKNNIYLQVYLSYKNAQNFDKSNCILYESYDFKRGYDTVATKRYNVSYLVRYFFCE